MLFLEAKENLNFLGEKEIGRGQAAGVVGDIAVAPIAVNMDVTLAAVMDGGWLNFPRIFGDLAKGSQSGTYPGREYVTNLVAIFYS